jgi:RimJ/RimL family protein N-acetyltransferase
MQRLQTARLTLREATDADAEFLVELMNEPDYLSLIGDRGVRTLEDAVTYLRSAVIFRYGGDGLGFNVMEGPSGVAIGICGLVERDDAQDVDLGYAVLACFAGQGYASEAAAAALAHAQVDLDLKRIVALTTSDNAGSRRVLEKIGMRLEAVFRRDSDGRDVCRYAVCAAQG